MVTVALPVFAHAEVGVAVNEVTVIEDVLVTVTVPELAVQPLLSSTITE